MLLESMRSAKFSTFFGTSGPYPEGSCPHHTSSLLVVLPNNGGAKKVDVDLDICTRLNVSPFTVDTSH